MFQPHQDSFRPPLLLLVVLLLLQATRAALSTNDETCYSRQHRDTAVDMIQALDNQRTIMEARVKLAEKDCILDCCAMELKPGMKCNMVVYKQKSQAENCYLFYCETEQDCPLMPSKPGINTYDIFKGQTHPPAKGAMRTTIRYVPDTKSSLQPHATQSTSTNTPATTTTTTQSTTTTTSTTPSTTTTATMPLPTTTATTATTIPATTELAFILLTSAMVTIPPTTPTTTTTTTTMTESTSTTTTTKAPPITSVSTTTTAQPPQPQHPHLNPIRPSKKPIKPPKKPEVHLKPSTKAPTTPKQTTRKATTPSTTPTATTTTTTTTTSPTTTTTTTTTTTSTTASTPAATERTTIVIIKKENGLKDGDKEPNTPMQPALQPTKEKAKMSHIIWKNSLVTLVVLTLIVLTLVLAIVGRKAMESFDRRHYTRLELNDLHYEI